MTDQSQAALEADEDEGFNFRYEWGNDFPEALDALSVAYLARPLNRHLGPAQLAAVVVGPAFYRAPTPRKPGKGKVIAQAPTEGEQEFKSRKNAQKECGRLIVPKGEKEDSDSFIRRMDACRAAPQALVVPMTPPEDQPTFAKRMMAVKETEEHPDTMIMPKTKTENIAEFEERLVVAKKTTTLVLPRGEHEDYRAFHWRLTQQVKSKRTIMPRSAGEMEKAFQRRCELQKSCAGVIHPLDLQREQEKDFTKRMLAVEQRTGMPFEPGDHKAVKEVIGSEERHSVVHEPKDEHEGEHIMHDLEEASKIHRQESLERHAAEDAEADKIEKEKFDEEHAKEIAEAKVAERIAEMKLAQEKAQAEAEEAAAHPEFGLEEIEIDKVGFMTLKKMLVERGVPQAEVNVPSKYHLKEVAAKHDCKIKWV